MENRLLALIAEVFPLRDVDSFRSALPDAVRTAVDADWISVNEVGPGPGQIRAVASPALDDRWLEIYARMADTNPLVVFFRGNRDGRAYRFSDVISPSELHEMPIWREFYAPIGIEHQLALVLASSSNRIIAIALSRRASSGDFSDLERDLLNEARPYLIQAYRNAIEHDLLLAQLNSRPPLRDLSPFGLTPREREVLLLVASGRTNAHAASELGIQPTTVKTHLERSYRKLGVRSRSEAARRLWGATASSTAIVRAL